MAYAKKTTTNKKTTNKNVAKVEPVETEVINETILEEEPKIEKTPVTKERIKHDASDGILCRSVTVGKLCMEGSNTKMIYRFMAYGDELEVEYRDLVSAVRSHSQYLFTPYLIVEDESFVAEFPELDKFYHEKFTVKELSDILLMNESEMEDAISVLPKGAKEQFINIVSTEIANGNLDSVRKIKALERILGVDFSLVAEIQ